MTIPFFNSKNSKKYLLAFIVSSSLPAVSPVMCHTKSFQ